MKNVEYAPMKAKAFAHNNTEVCIFIFGQAIKDWLALPSPFDVPCSLIKAIESQDSFSSENFLSFIEKLNCFRHTVSRITVYGSEDSKSLEANEMLIIFQLRVDRKREMFDFLNIFRRKDRDGLEKHRTVVGLFNTLFKENIEEVKDMRGNTGHDLPHNVNNIDVYFFTNYL